MVEVALSILILTVAAYLLSSTISASLSHTVSKRDQATAVEAVMNKMEELRATPFADVFKSFNDDPADDPFGAGTAPGSAFDVIGLDAVRSVGDAVVRVGSVRLPVLDGQLREDIEDPELGMPRDLSGDLVVDGLDHSGDALVLPVIVRVEWEGRLGVREFEMSTLLVATTKEEKL